MSSDYLPNWHQRMAARYEDVGVQSVYTNITGARSVVEVLPGTTNGYDAAKGLIRQGFHGCWVLALGTNDTADVAVGSNVGLAARITEMMKVTKGEPVMWVNVISLLHSGPYAEANMAKWNAALMNACAKYPQMRVFDWAALPKKSWFINDGIHYTSNGYEHRARDIANGLATAFPASGQSSGCLVSLPKGGRKPRTQPGARGLISPTTWLPPVTGVCASPASVLASAPGSFCAPSRPSTATLTGTRPRAAPSSILKAAARPSASANPSTPSAPDFTSRPGTAAISARSGRVVPDVHSG